MKYLSDATGKVIKKIYDICGDVPKQYSEELILEFDDKTTLKFYHNQDCCEHVYLDDICGDLEDLIDTPILEICSVSSRKIQKQ